MSSLKLLPLSAKHQDLKRDETNLNHHLVIHHRILDNKLQTYTKCTLSESPLVEVTFCFTSRSVTKCIRRQARHQQGSTFRQNKWRGFQP